MSDFFQEYIPYGNKVTFGLGLLVFPVRDENLIVSMMNGIPVVIGTMTPARGPKGKLEEWRHKGQGGCPGCHQLTRTLPKQLALTLYNCSALHGCLYKIQDQSNLLLPSQSWGSLPILCQECMCVEAAVCTMYIIIVNSRASEQS